MKYLIKFIVLVPLLVRGQSYKKDLMSAINNMSSLQNYSMRIHYKLYLDGNLNKPFQESITHIKKHASDLFYKRSDGEEFITNKNYEVFVDVNAKLITTKRKSGDSEGFESDKANVLSAVTQNMDTLMSVYEKIKTLNNTNERISYELILKPNESLKSMIVTINKEKKIIETVRYFYKNPTEIKELKRTKHTVVFEMSYEEFKTEVSSDKNTFSEKKYIVINNGKISPSEKYKAYKINFLN